MRNHLEALCKLSGVSGDEGRVRDYILAQAKAHETRVDALGNVFVSVAGRRRMNTRVLLAAHMDEVGFIVTAVTKDGFLKFAAVGGIDPRVLLGKRVLVGQDARPGIIGVKPVHLSSAEERRRAPKVEALFIDIGAQSEAEALVLVALGDFVSFARDWAEIGAGIASPALDDRIGCAVLLSLLEQTLPFDVTLAFTVQEELGLRGAMTAAHSQAPDIALILEGTTAADLAGVPAHRKVCTLGAGVVIPFMDGGTRYDPGLYQSVTALATAQNIPWQVKNVIAGGTDAAALQQRASGARVLTLAAPVRNIHSGQNFAYTSDLEHLQALTLAVLDEFEGRLV